MNGFMAAFCLYSIGRLMWDQDRSWAILAYINAFLAMALAFANIYRGEPP